MSFEKAIGEGNPSAFVCGAAKQRLHDTSRRHEASPLSLNSKVAAVANPIYIYVLLYLDDMYFIAILAFCLMVTVTAAAVSQLEFMFVLQKK